MVLSFVEYSTLPHVYTDVDGVLADFFGTIARLYPNHATDDWRFTGEDGWTLLPKHDYHLYSELDVLPDAKLLMDNLIALRQSKKIRLSILTAVPVAWQKDTDMARISALEKKQWVNRNFGVSLDDVMIVTRAEKPRFAGPRSVLIDDMSANIAEWNAAGGYGIHHTSAVSSLTLLRKYLSDES